MNGHLDSAVLARWNKWCVLDRTDLVIVKLCTACDVARMGTLSASHNIIIKIKLRTYSYQR